MKRPALSKELVAKLQALLDELEGQLDSSPDPGLVELRSTVGAALAALYRVSAMQRLGSDFVVTPFTRH